MTTFLRTSPSEPARPAELVAGPWLEQALSQVVRTPLHSLLGFLELLSMSELDDDQRRLHDQLVGSAEDLLSGSDRLLWLVRMLGGQYRPRPARVHLAAFVAEIAAASDGVVSDVVDPGAPQHVDTDLAALHQLVSELVTNARLHGGAPVVLAVSRPDGGGPGARITVSDGGTGLPAAARKVLTTPAPAAEPGQLGLVLVRRLADLLGIELGLDRMPRHIGAQIALGLPPALGAVAPLPPAPPSTAGAPTRPLRILLVEDNATNRLLTQRQLTRLGHAMLAADSGRKGIEAALASDDGTGIDVVLMDRHLPDIDGCEATERIRAGLPADRPYLPVIAVTADATQEAREACLAAGMDEVLTKPVDLQQLGGALARAAAAIDGGTRPADGPADGAARLPEAVRWILSRVDGDPESAAELIGTYLGELPGRRLRIQASLRRGEARAVFAAAESLRTSSESIGAQAVAGTCAALGAAATAADLAAARTFLPGLAAQCQQLTSEIGAFADAAGLAAALATPGR